MADKARKGVTDIFKMLWSLGDFLATIFLKLFDAQIKPMLLYGLGIWGLKECKSVEKIHTFAPKNTLKCQSKNTQWHCVRRDRSFSLVRSFQYVLYKVVVVEEEEQRRPWK